MTKTIVCLLALPLLAFAQFGSNAKKLSGKPLCSSVVTTNCVPALDANGNQAIGATVLSKLISYSNVACWGDSLTAGTGGTAYPTQLTGLLGSNTLNGGNGGDTSTQVKTRMLADTAHRNWFTVIWVGRNNYTATSTILSDVAAMVAALPSPKRFLVLSVVNDRLASEELSGGANYHYFNDINSALAAAYPNNYLDIRSLLVAAYDPGTPQDVIDHANDAPPSTLQPSDIHLNTAGYLFVARKVSEWIQAQAEWKYVLTVGDLISVLANSPAIGGVLPAGITLSNLLLHSASFGDHGFVLAGDNESLQSNSNIITWSPGSHDIKYFNLYSSDGTAGMTGTCGSCTCKSGLIVSCP